jgi:hypothetical protein
MVKPTKGNAMATAKTAPTRKAAKSPSDRRKRDPAPVEAQSSRAERFQADTLRLRQSLIDVAANKAAAPRKAAKMKQASSKDS